MKGDYNDECYRTACNVKPATYYNHSTEKHYCPGCANLINQHNAADAQRLFGHDLCTRVAVDPKSQLSYDDLQDGTKIEYRDWNGNRSVWRKGIVKTEYYGGIPVKCIIFDGCDDGRNLQEGRMDRVRIPQSEL